MDPQARATTVDEINRLIEDIKQRHAVLGTHNLRIYRGGKDPQYLLTTNGDLVYAHSKRPVELNQLTPRNLNAVKHQLMAHLMHISQ